MMKCVELTKAPFYDSPKPFDGGSEKVIKNMRGKRVIKSYILLIETNFRIGIPSITP